MLSPFHPMQLVLGLFVWAAYFAIAYAGVSVACSAQPHELESSALNPVNVGLLIFTLLVGAYLLFAAFRCWRAQKQLREAGRTAAPGTVGPNAPRRFIASLAMGVNLLAGLSTLLVGGPLLVLAPCLG